MFEKRPKPVVLMVLDGWGVAAPSKANAIRLAETPNLDNYISEYPTVTLQAAGEAVGLNWGEMGNSEVGHLSLGSGRIIYQSLPRITRAIADGSFFKNEKFLNAFKHVNKNNSTLHIMGLVSDGSVHSYNEHLYAIVEAAKQNNVKKVIIHAFLDGRDTSFNSGVGFITELQEKLEVIGVGKIATLTGRFYAMDRDNNWERIEKSYQAIVKGIADVHSHDPVEAIKKSYEKGVYDEELEPTVITNEADQPVSKVENNDAMIFFNFRADRARQMTKAFVLPSFDKFTDERDYMDNLYFVTMTEYEKDLPVEIAFPPIEIKVPLAGVIAQAGLKQLHIAETEKYAHVSFFFNGGKEETYPDEDRIMVKSPSVPSYDEKPEMSAGELTDKVIAEIKKDKYDFIVMNFANADMVAHTGNLNATMEALNFVDKCVARIVNVVLESNGAVFITADHGNAEGLFNLQTGNIDKEHSTSAVPFYMIANELHNKTMVPGLSIENLHQQIPAGVLSDVAPTMLKVMGLKKPPEMTGTSLF